MNLTKSLTFAVLSLLVVGAFGQQEFGTSFKDLPFSRIAVSHEIDTKCPPTGASDGNACHYAQNAAKNNFSAKVTPVALTIDDFSRLQNATQKRIDQGEIAFKGKYPEDRSRLEKIIEVNGKWVGEGNLVTLDAYVFGADYANTQYNKDSQNRPGKGEAVNCNRPELAWNDIHIALSSEVAPQTDECDTVTAELSPHGRPAIWDRFHDGLNAEVETLLPGLLRHKVIRMQQKGDELIYVRLTGPLFYDASHTPCKFNGKTVTERQSPPRRSIWEIHPVYRIQVRNESNQWIEFDEWAKGR